MSLAPIQNLSSFILDLSKTLVESGCSANRLESLVEKIGTHWGAEIECFAAQTTVIVSIKYNGATNNTITRINSWSVNLDRIQKINDFIMELSKKPISVEEAHKKLQLLIKSKSPYPTYAYTVAGAGAGAGLIYLLKGSILEIGIGFVLGSILSMSQIYFSRGSTRRYMGDFFSTFIVAIAALTTKEFVPSINENTVMIGCIVVIMPGLLFLNAIHEIALKNLISGTSKLVEALIITISISFGIAAAVSIAKLWGA